MVIANVYRADQRSLFINQIGKRYYRQETLVGKKYMWISMRNACYSRRWGNGMSLIFFLRILDKLKRWWVVLFVLVVRDYLSEYDFLWAKLTVVINYALEFSIVMSCNDAKTQRLVICNERSQIGALLVNV